MEIVACCRKNGRSIIYILYIYIFILNFLIKERKICNMQQITLKPLILSHFYCCRCCCRLLQMSFVSATILLHICCRCENFSILWHLQQTCNQLLLKIFCICNNKYNASATTSATHNYTVFCIFIHLQHKCNNFLI